MVNFADRIFEVTFNRAESKVACIKQDKALKLIEQQTQPKTKKSKWIKNWYVKMQE